MKKVIKILTIFSAISRINSCISQENITMEEIIEEIYENVENYEERPVYSVQVNKYNCRLYIENIGNREYPFVENNGESMMLPFNVMITKSGLQKVRIKVYPFEGEEFIDAGANVELTFYHAPDKDSNLSDYKKIASFSLPKNIGQQKLPYYESIVEFEANVPFDYSEELNSSKNLQEIPNIEKKVVKAYKELRNIIVENDVIGYNSKRIHPSIVVYNSLYSNKEEILKSENKVSGLVDSVVKNKEVVEIDNYDMRFYAGGKIVALWQKNLKPIMYMKGEVTNSEGETRAVEGGTTFFLYIPAHSNKLKVW